jgi:hypothetical protein
LWATVSESNSAFSWNTMPTSLRRWSSCGSGIVSMRSPFTWMVPPSGRSRPRMSLSSTDLPAPLAPSSIVMLPLGTVKLTSLSTT